MIFCQLCGFNPVSSRCGECGLRMCDDCRASHPCRKGTITLRPYQEEAVSKALDDLDAFKSSLLEMATGTGKTPVAAEIARRWTLAHGGRILVVAHRDELVRQAKKQFHRLLNVPVDIEMADDTASTHYHAPVVSASVQTLVSGPACERCHNDLELAAAEWLVHHPTKELADWDGQFVGCAKCTGGIIRRMQKFDPHDFSIVCLDESHHSAAKTWLRVVDYFRRNPNLVVLGITATAARHDKKTLGQIFTCPDISYRYYIENGVADGWLVAPVTHQVDIGDWDLSQISGRDDFNRKQLNEVLEREQGCYEVASAVLNHCKELKTVVYTESVRAAHKIADILSSHKLPAAAIDGKTPKHNRRRALQDFHNGDLRVIVNCAVLTEGWDEPTIQALVNARPTKSVSLYYQILGRGTRPLPHCVQFPTAQDRLKSISVSEKPDLVVIDCVGQAGKHKLVTAVDVIGKHYPIALREKIKALAAQSTLSAEEITEELQKLQDIEKEKEERARQAAAAIPARLSTRLRDACPFDLTPKKHVSNRLISPKLASSLIRFGVDPELVNKLTMDEARKLNGALYIRAAKGLATYKQCKILRRYNISINVSKKKASELISELFERDNHGRTV